MPGENVSAYPPLSGQKNILFIMLDQWRAECLSALGHAHVKTPNIDALAADGVLFKQQYCQAIPCGPSRASLHTGMYQHNHRSICNGTPLDAGFSNIALELRKAGYAPTLFGYTDTSLDPRQYAANDPVMRSYEQVLPGFDTGVLLDGENYPWIADLKSKGYEFKATEVFKPLALSPEERGRGRTYAPAFFKAEHSSAAFLCDELIKYLSVREQDKWCAHLSFYAPHHPYIAPAPYHAMVDPSDVAPPLRRESRELEAQQHPYLAHSLPNPPGAGASYAGRAHDNLSMDEEEIRQLRATYFGMISEVDAQIGRVIDYLKDAGFYENTLIIVTSDHGDQLGDHWQFGKHSYFDASLHVPLIIRDPSEQADAARGQQLDMLTESVDLMPSMLDWLGLDIPAQCDGRSLLDICRSGHPPADWRSEIHCEFDFRDHDRFDAPGRGIAGLAYDECAVSIIRDRHFKYVHFNAWPALLFDLGRDPHEFENLAQHPDYQQTRLTYLQKLLNWRMRYERCELSNIKLTSRGAERYPEGG